MIRLIFITFLFSFSALFSQTKFELALDSNLVVLSREIAYSQIHVRENMGNNKSKEINEYNRIAGVKYGSSYCCSGQYWAYEYASQKLNIQNPLPRTAVANQMYSLLAKKGKKVKYTACIDDFIVWQYPNSWQGHIERIYTVGKSGYVETIAFNVSLGKDISNDGNDGVTIKKRNIKHPLSRMKIRGLIGVKKCSLIH